MKPYPALPSLITLLLLTAIAAAFNTACTKSPAATPAATPAADLPIAASPTPGVPAGDTFAPQRATMVADGLVAWGITDPAVLQAMGLVPRHQFIPDDLVGLAYANHPLPIGYGQTISQPYIVALMTEALGITAEDKVLEIGTGSGYQAAVLSRLAEQVYTIEIIPALVDSAAAALDEVGYDNVTVLNADGYFGWEEQAPFDAIIVTAAPDHIPQPLVQQLTIGGRMVIPVGPIGGVQTLWLITRTGEETVRTQNLADVRFVPFTREGS
jgi:protein-L-isoaspartate(D-aspartate) O-methyltransferase